MNTVNIKNRLSFLAITILLLMGKLTYTQLYYSVPNTKDVQVKVYDEGKKTYKFPWAGGMNSCQFGEVDMDLDGKKDLFVFDRNGNRILPFLNKGTVGATNYEYAPEYIGKFPEIHDWIELVDYNADGKEDIFTYSYDYPGIIVYKNISVTTLEFELEVYPFLTSYQGGGYVNILVTSVDYPAITDIDNDGDLDILTFWGLGSFVEMHQNRSMELYGTPDSLVYRKVSNCWGYFAENAESNILYLDTCIGGKNCKISHLNEETDSIINPYRHTGSTFLAIDLDADNDKDILLGDVDYPNLVQLINGGNPDSAHIVSLDTLFPSYNKPVNLFSMAAPAYIDVNNDGLKDLLLSPFDPSLNKNNNYHSSWLYLNSGANNNPHFNFEMNNFIQDDMIDVGAGAYPVLFDYDGDGLLDLFVANYGYYIYSYYGYAGALTSVYYSNIALFRNSGTMQHPEFTQITHDFESLSSNHLVGIYPAFGDIDGDAKADMIIGMGDGTLWFYKNLAATGQPMEFGNPVMNFQNIDVGDFSTPQLYDLNKDGLLDLVIGEEKGNLNYYQNSGSATNPVFTLTTDSLGKVNVTDPLVSYTGFSTPCFFKNQANKTELITGSEQGKIFYFKNIDGNLGGKFQENDSLYLLIDNTPFSMQNGIRTGAAITDLDHDGFLDLVVGNFSGGLNYYRGLAAPPVIGINNHSQKNGSFSIFPNPAHNSICLKFTENDIPYIIEIDIFDLYSQKVISVKKRFALPVSIDVNSLTSGVYVCKVMFGDEKIKTSYVRFIISR